MLMIDVIWWYANDKLAFSRSSFYAFLDYSFMIFDILYPFKVAET